MGLILDSSVAIDRERGGLSAGDMLAAIRAITGPTEVAVCAVTVMELEHGIWRAKDVGRARLRQQFLEDLIGIVPVYPVTTELARRAGRIDAEQRQRGIQIALPDLLIGVSALDLGYEVGTGNVRDFERIPGLKITKL